MSEKIILADQEKQAAILISMEEEDEGEETPPPLPSSAEEEEEEEEDVATTSEAAGGAREDAEFEKKMNFYNKCKAEYAESKVQQRMDVLNKLLDSEEGKRLLDAETQHQRDLRLARKSTIADLPKEKQKIERIREKFNSFDLDLSGTIDLSEMKMLAESLCIPMSAEDIKSVFETIDTDGNGAIDFDEFYAWYVSDGKKTRRKSFFNTMRMKTRKRFSIVAGNIDEDRARIRLLKTAADEVRKTAAEEFAKTHEPPVPTNATSTKLKEEEEESASKEEDLTVNTLSEERTESLSNVLLYRTETPETPQHDDTKADSSKTTSESKTTTAGEGNGDKNDEITNAGKEDVHEEEEAEKQEEGRARVEEDDSTSTTPPAPGATIADEKNMDETKEDPETSPSESSRLPPGIVKVPSVRRDWEEDKPPGCGHTPKSDARRTNAEVDTTAELTTSSTAVSDRLDPPPRSDPPPTPSVRTNLDTSMLRPLKQTMAGVFRAGGQAPRAFEVGRQFLLEWSSSSSSAKGTDEDTEEAQTAVGMLLYKYAASLDSSAYDPLVLLLGEVACEWRQEIVGGDAANGARVAKVCAKDVGATDEQSIVVGAIVGIASVLNSNADAIEAANEVAHSVGMSKDFAEDLVKRAVHAFAERLPPMTTTTTTTTAAASAMKTDATKSDSSHDATADADSSAEVSKIEKKDPTMPNTQSAAVAATAASTDATTARDGKTGTDTSPAPPSSILTALLSSARAAEADMDAERREKVERNVVDNDVRRDDLVTTTHVIETVLGTRVVVPIRVQRTHKEEEEEEDATTELETEHARLPPRATTEKPVTAPTEKRTTTVRTSVSASPPSAAKTLPPLPVESARGIARPATREGPSLLPTRELFLRSRAKERAKTVENKLWNVFQFYCALPNGHSVPGQLKRAHFLQMLTDCGVVASSPRVPHCAHGGAPPSSVVGKLTVAEIDIAYNKAMSIVGRKSNQAMPFKAFCNALTVVGLNLRRGRYASVSGERMVSDFIRNAVLPNARTLTASETVSDFDNYADVLALWSTMAGEDENCVKKIFKHYVDRNPWWTERTANVLKMQESSRGFGWEQFHEFLHDFGLSGLLPQSSLKQLYTSSMSRGDHFVEETHAERREHAAKEYRPPPLSYKQFKGMLLRFGYQIARNSSSDRRDDVSVSQLCEGLFTLFSTMFAQLYAYAELEIHDVKKSVASWPRVELLRYCAHDFCENYVRVMRSASGEERAGTPEMDVVRRYFSAAKKKRESSRRRRRRNRNDLKQAWGL